MLGILSDFHRRLRKWYQVNRRDLPWRLPLGSDATPPLNPYHVLVSEAMLQQTQVATVIPYFHRFIAQFPTIQVLATADQQQVLRAWQGLGYYSRARSLQATAQKVVSDFNGQIPSTVDELLTLPGIGRYTAGAISSIAFGKRSPILDGNVARVLCRLDAITADPRATTTREVLWKRATDILPAKHVGDFNSSLMELGALICTPKKPQCLICPVQKSCEALSLGLVDKIPAPKRAKKSPLHLRWTFCIEHKGRYLVEQRPAKGRWAGMWQFATVEAPPSGAPSVDLIQLHYKLAVKSITDLGTVEHALTHRRYRFTAFTATTAHTTTGHWASLEELNHRPMPLPHSKVREMLLAITKP